MIKCFFLLLFCVSAFSQDCKFATNKVDDFDKIKIIETKERMIFTKVATTFYASLIHDKSLGLKIRIVGPGSTDIIVDENNLLQILLNNGKAFQLIPAGTFYPQKGDFGMNIVKLRYSLSISEMEAIKESGIAKIRLSYGADQFDCEIKQKLSEKFNSDVNCFLKEL